MIFKLVKNFRRHPLLLIALLILVTAIPIIVFTFKPKPATAAWFDDAWTYRMAKPIATHTASENNVYINLTGANDLDTSIASGIGNKIQSDCGDLRFTKENGEILPYYIASGCLTADTVVQVFFNTMPAGAQTIYIYYGNPSAANGTRSVGFTTEASSYTFSALASEEKTTGPVAYFKFDEGSGTTSKSSVGTASGTLTSSPTWQPEDLCVSGKCLQFNGTSSYVTAVDGPDLRPTNVTVAAWVKSNTASRYVVAKDPPGPPAGTEIVADRTYNQKVISLGGNERKAEIHGGDIFYKKDGSFEPIDTTLLPTAFGWQMNAASYHLNLPNYADQWFDFVNNYGGEKADKISIKALGVTRTPGQLVPYDADGWNNKKIIYPNAFGNNTDLVLRARNIGFDKLVVINQKPADLSRDLEYSFEINIPGFTFQNDGNSIILEKLQKTWFREFRMWDSARHSQKIQFRLENINGKTILTKILDKNFLEKAVYPVYTDTTASYYAGSGDGSVDMYGTPTTWSQSHDATSGLDASTTNTEAGAVAWEPTWSSGEYWLERTYLPINTSGIPSNATISSASLNIYVTSSTNTDNDGTDWISIVQTTQPSETALTNADYDLCGAVSNPTEGIATGERKDISSISTSAYLTMNLNSTGLGWIKKSGESPSCGATNGFTCLGVREGHDITNTAPNVNTGNELWYSTSDTGGTSQDPYLSVTYTVPKTNVPYALNTTSGGEFYIMKASTEYKATATGDINDNKWHYLVGTYDGTTMTLYVDGVAKATNTNLTGNLPVDVGPLNIGADYQEIPANFFKGNIDDVKIYNYARTAAQIKSDYNSKSAASAKGAGVKMGAQTTDALSNGLVGYWKLDEASGNATDYSGNGSTLTDGSSTTYAAGKFGQGADLESGSTDYLYAADNAALSVTGDLTIAGWIKPESVTAATLFNIASKFDGTPEAYQLSQYGDEIRLYVDAVGNYATTDAANLTTGNWYHVAAVYSTSGTIKIYINGTESGSTITGTIPSSITDDTARFQIGAEDTTGGAANYYDGIIDEVRIYNRSFVPAEITQLYSFSPGLVGYWKFDEGSGTTVNDGSGNGKQTTFSGTSPYFIDGKYGKAGYFNGSNTIATVGTGNHLTDLPKGDFSFSFWQKINTGICPSFPILAGKRNGLGSIGWAVWTGSAALNSRFDVYFPGGTNATYTTNNNFITNNVWSHLTYIWLSSTKSAKIYVNGQETTYSSQTPGSGTYSSDSAIDLSIGYTGAGASYCGAIDEFRIYNYAINQKQMVQDMNAGHPAVGSPVGSALIHLDFEEGSGTTANNSGSTGNANNGTLNTAYWEQNGKFGKGVRLNGSSGSNVSINDFSF